MQGETGFHDTTGYTMTELMIVVALLGILAAVLIPIAGDAINKSKDATTLGNLAAMREALELYHTIEGTYPQFPAGQADAAYGPLLHDTLVPVYLREIPVTKSARGYHKDSNLVDLVWNQIGQADNEQKGYGEGWRYDANPRDKGTDDTPGFGSIRVLCTHYNTKGVSWTTF